MKKFLTLLICLLLSLSALTFPVYADVDYPIDSAYSTYIYSNSNEPVYISSAFTVDKVVSGRDITDIEFSNLSDVFYSDGCIYICDTDNNRIVVTDNSLELLYEISSFSYNGNQEVLNAPQGVWADKNSIYIADTGNQRIVSFNRSENGVVLNKIFNKPNISLLGQDYVYSPKRLTVDVTGKMYVISAGVNEGIICLDENGVFQSFLGAPQVEPNFLETLWRKIATKEQLDRMESYVPTEYNAITMDSYGFLYVASATSNSVPVGKLNSDGDNVLVEPKIGQYGDLVYLGGDAYAPYFTDITLYDSNRIGEDFYYVIDSKQGKIYAYTEDGYLLYAFGDNDDLKGTFYNATAIEYIQTDGEGAGKILVTDGFKGTLTIYKETDFALNIKEAIRLYNLGEYEKCEELWNKVKKTCSNYRLADIGLAKIEIHNKEYKQAMSRLLEIREHELYADAFEGWRDTLIRENFSSLLFVVIAVIVLIFVLLYFVKKSRPYKKIKDNSLYKSYKYGDYVMLHPFDGFWDLKHEKKGNVKSATLIGILFLLIWGLRAQFGGYVITATLTSEVNALYNMLLIFLPLLLYVVANWCFTTLMDGKGTLKDIYVATCYSLKPYVIFGVPMLLLSNVLTLSEASFYAVFDIIIFAWMIFLLFAGLMTTHDYSLGKTVLTVILILVGICLIIFIVLLMFSIVQNIYQFIYNCYQELSFRSY